MRTTISLDDDVMESVRDIAEAHRESVGRVVSDLLRQALAPTPRLDRAADGLPIVRVPMDARTITPEAVARAVGQP